MALDAAETFPVVSELLATQWVFDNYGDQTTGVRSASRTTPLLRLGFVFVA